MEIEKEERCWCVYIHTNKINNKAYIGITSNDVNKRWKNGNGYKNNKYFYTSIQKYGWDNFEHIIWQNNLSKNQAQKIEILLIALFDTTNPNNGYNLSTGGEGSNGIKRTKDTKEKIRKSAKTRFSNPENNPMFGKQHSDEAKRKMSKSRQGMYDGNKNPMYGRTWWDDETPSEKIDEWKKKKSIAASGEKNPNYGVVCSDEKRKKIINSVSTKKKLTHFDVDGITILETYLSIREANRRTNIDRRTLVAYCNGTKHPDDHTIWKFNEGN